MELLAWMVGLSAAITALGWVKQTWFFSVGYAFSVVAMMVVTAVAARDTLTPLVIAQLLLLTVWGVRLGVFLLSRERAASYAQRPEVDRGLMPVGVRLAIWAMCLLLYPAMVAPAVLAAQTPEPPEGGWLVATVVGLTVLALGVAIEWAADAQKQRAKASAPKAFVAHGLYGWVRVPNYLGEIMVWLGNVLAGAYALAAWGWAVSLVGAGVLVFIMVGATRRIERTQKERYGDEPDFRKYVRTVPVLVPWVPVYSLRRLPVPEL